MDIFKSKNKKSTPKTWRLPIPKQINQFTAGLTRGLAQAARLVSAPTPSTARTRRQFLPYLNLAMIVLFFLGAGIFGYQQFNRDVPTPLAYPTTLTRPNRDLSFQGRLTDTAYNPITSATNMQFKLYDNVTGGSLLWESGTCSITPDQDGIFTSNLGDDCGSEITDDVFTENANVWLEVTIAAETLDPRQPIKSVAYALNAETVQGYPASASAVENTVIVMDNNGEIVLGNATPVLKSTGASFAIEAQALTLQTSSGSDGDITLSPDGTGRVNINSDLALDGFLAAPGATLSANYAEGVALVLKGGPSGTADIQQWQNNSGTPLTVVDNSGNIGIGSTDPTAALDVGGNATITSAGVITGTQANIDNLRLDGNTLSSTANEINITPTTTLNLNSTGDMTFDSSADIILDADGADVIFKDGGTALLNITNSSSDVVLQPQQTDKDIIFKEDGGTEIARLDSSAESLLIASSKKIEFADTGEFITSNGTDLTIASGNHIVLSPTANVGIGTTSPSYKLDVNGDIRIASGSDLYINTTGLNDNAGAASGASLVGLYDDAMTYVAGNTTVQSAIKQLDTAIGTVSGSAGGWTDDGTVVRLTTSTDNVGIGTTNPGTYKLYVEGSQYISGVLIGNPGANYASFNAYTVSDPGANEGYGFTGTSAGWTMDVSPLARTNADGNLNFYGTANNIALWRPQLWVYNASNYTTATAQSSGGLDFTNTGGHITFNPTGNVGIGTTSPTALLDIAGTASSSGTLAFRGTTDPKIDILNGENFGIRTSVGGDAGLTERLTVLSGGNVGIGSTSPGAKLDVAGGNIRLGNGYYLQGIRNTSSATINLFGITTGTDIAQITVPNSNAAQALNIVNTGATNLMTIYGNGSVGIGTTAPTYLLDVNGTGRFTGAVDFDGDIELNSTLTDINGSVGSAGEVLSSTGSGVDWVTLGSASITDDSLDYVDFEDTMDLDANLTLNQTTYTWSQTYTGTTGTGYTYTANSLTSGGAISVASSATGLTGDLVKIENTGNNAGVTGNALKVGLTGAAATGTALNVTTAGTSGYALRINDDGTYTDSTPFVVDVAGNVGIGSTVPAQKLEVVGSIRANLFEDEQNSAYYLDPAAAGTSMLTAGNVGIGTTTASSRLYVSGGTQIIEHTNGTNNLLRLRNISNIEQVLDLGMGGQGGSYQARIAGQYGLDIRSISNNAAYYMSFATANTERMRINNDGNVGIGTTSPDVALEVNGAIHTSRLGTYGTYNSAEVQGIWSISEAYPISVASDNFGTQYGMGYAYSTNGGAPLSGVHQIVFTNNGTVGASIGLTGTAYFAGNVGIGSTAPAAKLDIGGSSSTISNTSGDITIASSDDIFLDINANELYIGDGDGDVANAAYRGTITLQQNRGVANGTQYAWMSFVATTEETSLNIGYTGDGVNEGNVFMAARNGLPLYLAGASEDTSIELSNNNSIIMKGQIYRGLPIRFTRDNQTTTAASDATKDTQCTTEFGSAYQAASISDVAILSSGGATDAAGMYFIVAGHTTYRFYHSKNYTDNINILQSVTSATTNSVACVRKDAPILISRTTSGYNTSDATKDADCTADFGTNYRAANIEEVAAYYGELGISAGANLFNVAQNTANSFYPRYDSGNTSTYLDNTTGGTYGTACIMKDPEGGADYAETIATSQSNLLPGELLVLDPNTPEGVIRSEKAYDNNVVGVVPTSPGLVIGEEIEQGNQTVIALVGRVPIRVSQKNGPINIGDAITTSDIPGVGMKATEPGPIVGKAMTSFSSSNPNEIAMVTVFVSPMWNWSGTSFSSEGQLVINQTNNDEFRVTPVGQNKPISQVVAYATAVVGKLKAGLVETQKLVVRESAQIANLSVDTLSVGGKTIQQMISSAVNREVSTQIALLPTATPIPVPSIEATPTPTTPTPTPDLSQPTELGELLTKSIETDTLVANSIDTTSARIEALEAGMAQLDSVRAVTAELTTATVSGTLYASHIDKLDEQIAQAFEKPSLLALISGQASSDQQTSTSASLADLTGVVEGAGLSATSAAELNLSLADLGLVKSDSVLTAEASFVNSYFKVNGSAYVADALGVGNRLLVGNSLQVGERVELTENYLAFNPGKTMIDGVETELNTFYIQPSGLGTLSLMADLLILDESGRVDINGDVFIAGNVRVEETLLADMLAPTDFGNPLQVQVAGLSTNESGSEIKKESRFEIVNELGAPVATISAQGKANFAGGIGVGAENLGAPSSSTSAELAASKTSGRATIPAGTNQLTINHPEINADSLIYVTPLGSTANQVLYVKSQTPAQILTTTNPDGTTNQTTNPGSFIVGFDSPAPQAVEFNWWIVN